MNKKSIFAISLLVVTSATYAAELYVSPTGLDTNSGAKDSPLGSLAAAQDQARGFAGKSAVTVHVADGVYYLPDTLTFSPADSGTTEMPIVYRAENEGGAVLSGGSKLELTWSAYKNGIFQAQTPAGLNVDQLFINGKNQRMARYPNYDPAKKAEPYQGYSAEAFSKDRAANWADPAGGYIHAMHRSGWGGYHYLITGKNAKGEVEYEGGWQNNRQMGMHKDHRMVENVFEELDAPGEWFHNSETNTLYYMPAQVADLHSAKVEVVRLRHLIEFQGSESQPVKHIRLQGFVVRHAARTFMDCKEPLLRSDWAIYRGGAFLLTGTEDIQILDTEFDQVGGNAVFVNNYNRNVLVKGCHIHDAGASGVCFVGDPNAARDPLFEYQETNDLSTMDRTVGPQTNNYPADSAVEDCLIHGIGRVERQPAGVQISMAMSITVRDCSIYDTARAGINVSEGTWGGHLIERCDVFDTVLETHDHGSFNSWGRDRFWHNDRSESQRVIDEDPNLPFLDAMHTTTIRDSRWRCDHGWDIDLDDGSTNYEIYNNVMLAGGLKLREGFRRRAWNNITVHSGLHPHVWYNQSGDEVFHNIFMSRHKPARMNRPFTDQVRVDENFFGIAKTSVMSISKTLGWDENSAFGDPMFMDPSNGDFRVKEGSPALKVGFKNFPMDQFGVKKASLRAIARTPDLSAPKKVKRVKKAAPKRIGQWMGATLGDLSGAEFSAYGVSKQAGGIALKEVPAGSKAAQSGLQEGDLIQGLNGQDVSNQRQFSQTLKRLKTEKLTLKVIRNQQIMELVIPLDTNLSFKTASATGSKKQPVEMSVKGLSVIDVETASAASGFVKLRIPTTIRKVVTANQKTNNDPLSSLVDSQLSKGFGPVFRNGIKDGAYKMDLGAAKPVAAVTSWSHNQANMRGAQKLTVYGSNASSDPGWELSAFTPLGTIDTTGRATANYTAASVRAVDGKSLGNFRWIVWAVSPVTEVRGGENTAFQELAVEVVGEEQEVNTPAVKGPPVASLSNPNIVFVMTDDQRWDTLGCYQRRTDVLTPNIDKLSENGVTFDNAYYAVAICMPSRTTMFTGRYFSDHQVGFTYPYNRTLPAEEFADSYPARLREAGYRTGFVGKFGVRLEDLTKTVAENFDFYVGVSPTSKKGPIFPADDEKLKEICRKDRDPRERTLIKGDAMIRFLETQPEGQPFCLSVSFDAVKNDRDSNMYAPHVKVFEDQEMWVPENYVVGKSARLPKVLDYCRGTYLHVQRNATPEEYQRRTRRFAVQGYTVDLQVKRLMDKLEEMGVLENTIVIYTSDNGRFHGSQGLFDKAILYEEAMKQPLIVFDGRAPKEQRGRRVDAMVSSVDVAPTILSLAGESVPERMKGLDLSDLLKGEQDISEWRDTVLMENFFIQEMFSAGRKKGIDPDQLNEEIIANNRSYRTRGVRTERYKYFKYHEHDPVVEELYDLEADPHEQNNLISNPEYADLLTQLRSRTDELHLQLGE